MKTYKKIILGIVLILIIFIALLIGINIGNKNSIQKPLSELQKLTETSEENSFITTEEHLSEVNSSIQSGIEQGKSEIWESIRNSETLSSKTDSSGNPIYGNVNDLSSLENAIATDNNALKPRYLATIDSIRASYASSYYIDYRNGTINQPTLIEPEHGRYVDIDIEDFSLITHYGVTPYVKIKRSGYYDIYWGRTDNTTTLNSCKYVNFTTKVAYFHQYFDANTTITFDTLDIMANNRGNRVLVISY